MTGNPQHRPQSTDFKDPFNAGQMVGMLVMLTFIEQNGGIKDDTLQQLKEVTASNVQIFLDKPTEDIFLMINEMVGEIELA